MTWQRPGALTVLLDDRAVVAQEPATGRRKCGRNRGLAAARSTREDCRIPRGHLDGARMKHERAAAAQREGQHLVHVQIAASRLAYAWSWIAVDRERVCRQFEIRQVRKPDQVSRTQTMEGCGTAAVGLDPLGKRSGLRRRLGTALEKGERRRHRTVSLARISAIKPEISRREGNSEG